MSLAKITMHGFESWLNYENSSLFANWVLPEGIDKDVLIGNIMMKGGEFEVLFSNPYTMRKYIELFGKKNFFMFNKWIEALHIEYNPLENYDRQEEWTDEGRANDVTHGEASTIITDTNNSTTDNKVTAYETDTLHEKEQDVTFSSANGTQTNESDTENTNTSSSLHSGRVHGNIGVTTSQQMLQAELDIARWNIYEHITDLFLQEFCILVYS